MASTGLRCAYCGWQNEPSARMCGGCGRPLTSSGMKAAISNGGVPPDEAITDPELHTVAAPRATPVAPPLPSGRRVNPVARVFLILGVIALIIACICAGAWGGVIRPSLHNQVDTSVRAQMNDLADQANLALTGYIPLIRANGGSYDGLVLASKFNDDIKASESPQNPASNTHVSFAEGQLKITFDSNNQQNSISTTLATASGRLVARNTTVTGLIAIIESGPELEAAINDALSRLPPDPQFKSVTLADDVLSYTLTVKRPVTPAG
jgi:hypothetical protein